MNNVHNLTIFTMLYIFSVRISIKGSIQTIITIRFFPKYLGRPCAQNKVEGSGQRDNDPGPKRKREKEESARFPA